MAMLGWIAVVAVGMFWVVNFYKNLSNNRVEQVTVIREAIAPAPNVPQIAASGPEQTPFPDQPASVAPSIGFPAMPTADKSLEPESPPFVDEPQTAPPTLRKFPRFAGGGEQSGGAGPSPDEPEPIDTPSVNYRSLLAEGEKKEDKLR